MSILSPALTKSLVENPLWSRTVTATRVTGSSFDTQTGENTLTSTSSTVRGVMKKATAREVAAANGSGGLGDESLQLDDRIFVMAASGNTKPARGESWTVDSKAHTVVYVGEKEVAGEAHTWEVWLRT